MKRQSLLLSFVAFVLVLAILGCATASRSTEEVFLEHHKMVETLGPDETDKILADYTDESILILTDGTTLVGLEAIEAGFKGFLKAFPGLDYTKTTHYIKDDWIMVVWEGTYDGGTIPLSVDAFLIRNGKILRQVCWTQVVPKK
jgi:hypothetical protein